MKKRFRMTFLLLLCAGILCLFTCAAFGEEQKVLGVKATVRDGLTDDERFEDYVAGLFGLTIPNPVHNRVLAYGVTLKGDMLEYYNFLKTCIQEVASGERTSTQFTISKGFTLDNAGSQKLLDALLVDFPYELYWFDKTVGYNINYSSIETTFSFTVNEEYADGTYKVDPSKVNRANAAVKKVNSIISKYASSSDYAKLKGYKNTICNLVTYNEYAAEHEDADSNAWQLIWVFDGDSSTNVVCEGYSKAFKYLCDRSSFSGNVSCLIATGAMGDDDGTGAHMWNLVRMPNGKTYMADITNCDSGSIGEDSLLFLAGYYSGSVQKGYCFRCDYGNGSYEDIYYYYDSHTKGVFSTDDLTISSVGYTQQSANQGTIGDALSWTLSDEGTLTITGTGSTGEVDAAPWSSAKVREVEIEEGVTGIGSSLFSDCTDLASVTLPASVESIGENAFPKEKETLYVVCGSYAQAWARENGYKNLAEDASAAYGYTGIGHQDTVTTEGVDATCTEDGITDGTICSTCGDIVILAEVIPAKGHVYVSHMRLNPFCGLTGIEAYWSCSSCGKLFSDAEGVNEIQAPVTIPALAHNIAYREAVEPTIFTTGTEEYWECIRCGKLFSDSEGTNEISEPVVIPRKEPEDKVEAFVMRCYDVILGRVADPDGLEDWTNQLKSGERTAAEIIDGFVNSQEFLGKTLSNEAAVTVLYNAMLNRDPDAAGLANWTKVLEAGNPFGVVINGFCGSEEFKNLCSEYGIRPGSVNVVPTGARAKIEAFVKRCYEIILSRGADAEGLTYWADALEQGTKTAAEIIDGFVNSREFLGKALSNEAAVTVLYNVMLNRDPDATGLMNWTNLLNNGSPFAVVINGFCGSAEFAGICSEYGIKPGSVTVKGMSEKGSSITPANSSSGAAAKAVRASEYTNEEKIREFVRHCYVSALGREADEEGLRIYTEDILQGVKTPKQVARGFISSDEFRSRQPGNEEMIRILYQLYLYRDADEAGLAEWTAQLNGGATLESVADGFANSKEFRRIVNGLK